MGLVVQVLLEIKGPRAPAVIGRGWIVGEAGVVHREIDRIEPKPIDAAIEPELAGGQKRFLNLRVMHIQVRLGREEVVHVILAAPGVPGPGGSAKHRLPVGRGRALRLGVAPDIPVGLGVGAVLAAFLEPGMVVGGVGIDLVDDDLQAQTMRLFDQAIKIRQPAENGVDIAIIGNVIAEIGHGRGEEGRQPDTVYAQRGDIVQFLDNARQVADAVAIGIGETAGIDLVDHRALPPQDRRGRGRLLQAQVLVHGETAIDLQILN